MSFDDWGSGGGGYGGSSGGYSRGGGGGGGGGGGYQSSVRDGDSEYIRLNSQVTENIHAITQNVASLQKMVNFLGTQRDVPEMRDRMHAIQEQTKNYIRDCSQAIKQMGNFDGGAPAEARKRRMQRDRLSKDFKAALQKFQTCSQVAISKERETVVQQRERAESMRHESNAYHHDERTALIEEDQRRQMQQMDEQIDFTDAMIQEREEGIKEIEATMMEVNEIYRDLSTLVVEQGQQLDNIESNMSSASTAVEAGTGHLGQANVYQKKARNKMCCMLIIVAVVAAILTIVLVVTLKKKK